MRKINLPKEFLQELYVEREMSTIEIARELGVNRQTISNKLNQYGIEIRNSEYVRSHKPKPRLRKIPKYRIKSEFEKAYTELKAIDLVAEHFGINAKTAFKWKKIHNIETLKEYSWKGKEQINRDKPYTNKEWLENMYAKYSFEDIGKLLNCSPSTVQKWAKRFNIPTRTVKEQWEIKAKSGERVIKRSESEFDLQAYKRAYVDKSYSCNTHLPKGLKNFIISLYSACESCGYTEVLDLHHIDEDHNNNSPENHGVLCPNCHAKIHRLGKSFNELVPNHVTWDTLLDSYQEAK